MNCWNCGKETIDTWEYLRSYCDECKVELKKQAELDHTEYLRLKNKMMIERAVRRIGESIDNLHPITFYKTAINAVQKHTELHPSALASTEEAITAIVLAANNIPVRCQYRILDFKVDFMIPKYKMVLEIDGVRHNKYKDSKRDLLILHALGAGWEIVRISTEDANRWPEKLPHIITNERARKEAFRKKHEGTLAIEMAEVLKQKELEKENARRVKEIDAEYDRKGIFGMFID